MINLLIPAVSGLLDKFIEDKDEKAKLAHEIATLADQQAHENAMGQLKVNKTESGHRTIFVAGWRPFIGWVCGLALAFNYLVFPFINMYLISKKHIPMTPLDISELMPVLLGMLGLGAYRSFEKYKGISK